MVGVVRGGRGLEGGFLVGGGMVGFARGLGGGVILVCMEVGEDR